MKRLPKELKMTFHSQQRLEERKNANMKYNTKNIMRSSVKWYGKSDLIHDCALYRHCCYTTRKSNQIGYITDGDIEVIYNKNTKIAITVLEVKDKFKPITQYIKPEILEKQRIKKENLRMKKDKKEICPDCGREEELNEYDGICARCKRRKVNALNRKKEYVPYIKLSEAERRRIDICIRAQHKRRNKEEEVEDVELKVPDSNNYYQSKAEQTPINMHPMKKPTKFDPLSDQSSFISILKECGCDILEENLKDVLNVLIETDKLKNILMTVTKNTNQQTILDLEQVLNTTEKKLQYNWEYNGFQEIDDLKFKGFLVWRRLLKDSILFWKKLYQTNILTEMQKMYDTDDTTDDKDKNKKFQITTESISTIFNTRRPFTRVFYAPTKEDAYEQFVKWMADRQLHEDKSKTIIVELKMEGEDGREKEN